MHKLALIILISTDAQMKEYPYPYIVTQFNAHPYLEGG